MSCAICIYIYHSHIFRIHHVNPCQTHVAVHILCLSHWPFLPGVDITFWIFGVRLSSGAHSEFRKLIDLPELSMIIHHSHSLSCAIIILIIVT